MNIASHRAQYGSDRMLCINRPHNVHDVNMAGIVHGDETGEFVVVAEPLRVHT